MKRSLMAVHAHPDDEVFSTGGVLAKYAENGDRVVVVYCTNGDVGEMFDPDLDPAEAVPRLGQIRQQEARQACAVLGVTEVYFLGYRDSGMKDTEENQNPAAFANVPLEVASDKLEAIMRETKPDVVITYDTEGGYGHPDHVMTHRVSDAAFGRYMADADGPPMLYYSARSREGFRRYLQVLHDHGVEVPWVQSDFNIDEYGLPDDQISAAIDVAQYVSLKKTALAVHKTQIKPDFFYLQIPDDALVDAGGCEYFVRVSPPPTAGRTVTNLFTL